MNPFNIDSILDELKEGALNAAKEAGTKFLETAGHDALNFVQAALPALARYADLLLAKQITEDEFTHLVLGLRDLAEMNGLTAAGLAAIEVDKTRNGILKVVSSVVVGAVSKIV